MKIRLSKDAEQDLRDVWSYIAADNPKAADSVLDQITATMRSLSNHPRLGRARDELRPGLRSIVSKSYILYYVIDPEAIVVVRVLHGGRDAGALLPPNET